MRSPITFDGAVLADGPITGVGRAFLTTLAAYVPRAAAPCALLLPRGAEPPRIPGLDIVDGAATGLARQLKLPLWLRRVGARLLHSPVAAVPLGAACPVVATIHDLPWLHAALRLEAGCALRHRLAARLALLRAAAVVVPSHATVADLRRWAGANAARRAQVVWHGVAPPATPTAAADLSGPFLVLGDDRPRKNVARIRAAHAQARALAPELPALRLVGPGFGYATEPDKVAALRSARALLQLSLHEGFGLPLVEAMAHGVPALCSDIPSLREVAAGAALHVDPTDVAAMARAMVRIHVDADLRAQLRRSGLARAADLTPEQSAAGWLALHAAVLAGRERLATSTP